MTRILLFDTETNGLPSNRSAPPSEFRSYPAILQLSWTIIEWDSIAKRVTTVEHRDFAPPLAPEIVWDVGAERIHKIRESDARSGDGTTVSSMLIALTQALQSVDCIVAHNLPFDKIVVQAAGFREKLPQVWPTNGTGLHPTNGIGLHPTNGTGFDPTNGTGLHPTEGTGFDPTEGTKIELCTMSHMRDIMKLPASAKQLQYNHLSQYKYPRLGELYNWLFNSEFIGGEHSSRADVTCLEECLTEMLFRGLILGQT